MLKSRRGSNTGYGTVAKKKSSISQVKVSAATIENPNASLIQTLSGQVAGLDISVNSGQPESQC
jgi:hypothetical protein